MINALTQARSGSQHCGRKFVADLSDMLGIYRKTTALDTPGATKKVNAWVHPLFADNRHRPLAMVLPNFVTLHTTPAAATALANLLPDAQPELTRG